MFYLVSHTRYQHRHRRNHDALGQSNIEEPIEDLYLSRIFASLKHNPYKSFQYKDSRVVHSIHLRVLSMKF